jgi:hypothetical protein
MRLPAQFRVLGIRHSHAVRQHLEHPYRESGLAVLPPIGDHLLRCVKTSPQQRTMLTPSPLVIGAQADVCEMVLQAFDRVDNCKHVAAFRGSTVIATEPSLWIRFSILSFMDSPADAGWLIGPKQKRAGPFRRSACKVRSWCFCRSYPSGQEKNVRKTGNSPTGRAAPGTGARTQVIAPSSGGLSGTVKAKKRKIYRGKPTAVPVCRTLACRTLSRRAQPVCRKRNPGRAGRGDALYVPLERMRLQYP